MAPYSKFLPHFYGFSLFGWPGLFVLLLTIWSVFWKGWALWEAAKNEDKGWFVCVLLFNIFGILEIAYLFFFSPNSYFNREKVKRFFSR